MKVVSSKIRIVHRCAGFVVFAMPIQVFGQTISQSAINTIVPDECAETATTNSSLLAFACATTRCAKPVTLPERKFEPPITADCSDLDPRKDAAKCKARCLDKIKTDGKTGPGPACDAMKAKCPSPNEPQECEDPKVCRLIDESAPPGGRNDGSFPCTFNVSAQSRNGKLTKCELRGVQFQCNYKCLAPVTTATPKPEPSLTAVVNTW